MEKQRIPVLTSLHKLEIRERRPGGHICRFLLGPEANSGVSIFKWLTKVQSIIFWDTGKQYKMQGLVSTRFIGTRSRPFVSAVSLAAMAELRRQQRKPKTPPIGAFAENVG